MVGSCLGTSTVASYLESAAVVEEGGRTGLTSLVVSLCFLLSLFFHPLIRAIPLVATAAALVVVVLFMMHGISELEFHDFVRALPALLIIVLIPRTFRISEAKRLRSGLGTDKLFQINCFKLFKKPGSGN